MKRFAVWFCLAVLASGVCAQQALAVDAEQWQDWQVTIAMQSFSPYLDYPDSPVSKLIKASVSFSQPAKREAKSYEDLYYTSSQVLGCRRNGELAVTPGTTGAIRVTSSNSEQSYGAANAIGRIFLDLFIKKCPTKVIVVPLASFNDIVGALCNQGFRIAPPVPDRRSQGTPALFILTIISEPAGASQEILM